MGFKKLKGMGVKLKPSKCEFFRKNVMYLGHGVSEKGKDSDIGKTEMIINWSTYVTVMTVHGFLGFTNCYRRFIKKYA